MNDGMMELTEEEIADVKQRAEAIRKAKIAEKIEEMDIPWEKSIVLSDLIIEKNFDTELLMKYYWGYGQVQEIVRKYDDWAPYYAQIYPDKYKHLMDNCAKIEIYLSRHRAEYEKEEMKKPWWRRMI